MANEFKNASLDAMGITLLSTAVSLVTIGGESLIPGIVLAAVALGVIAFKYISRV